VIDEVADDSRADIVVTGARGIGSVHELFSGSLSHHLIQHSDKPVLAIPTPGDD
jgi:nucleotide-binding universal stress UspA family protein